MAEDYRSNAEVFIEGAEYAARRHWGVLVIEGVALVLFGILALFIPPLITLGIASALGWLFLSAGAIAILVHFRYRALGLRYLLFSAILSAVAGLALLAKPLSGVISLTVIIILCFGVAGVAKLTFPLERFRYLQNYRGWIRASGIIDLMLAALMFAELPDTALWAPGLLLGTNMILGGLALIAVALLERRKPAPSALDQIGGRCSMEKGGNFPADNSAGRASSACSVPSHNRSTMLVMANSRFMSMPSGLVATISDKDVPSSLIVSLSQSGNTLTGNPRARPRRSAVTTVRSVVCP